MINIKNKLAIQKMRTAGKLLAEVFKEVSAIITENVSTLEIDGAIAKLLAERQLVSQTKGYKGYKHVSCISVNDEVVHGVPRSDRLLQTGDLVKIDICAAWKGYCADSARCFVVGKPSVEMKKFIAVAQESLQEGIKYALAGNRISDISSAIQKKVESYGYGVVRDFAGHGIGKRMHEEPEILNYGAPGKGALLMPGMTFALEPMITLGAYAVYVDRDGWTVKTKDKSWAAHVEDTVLVTSGEPEILTKIVD